MAIDTDRATIMCVPVGLDHGENSTLDVCVGCGREVWVSPSGRDIITEKGAQIACTGCAMPHITAPGAEVEPPNEAQLEEIRRERKRRGW